jgi:hypothetical protein
MGAVNTSGGAARGPGRAARRPGGKQVQRGRLAHTRPLAGTFVVGRAVLAGGHQKRPCRPPSAAGPRLAGSGSAPPVSRGFTDASHPGDRCLAGPDAHGRLRLARRSPLPHRGLGAGRGGRHRRLRHRGRDHRGTGRVTGSGASAAGWPGALGRATRAGAPAAAGCAASPAAPSRACGTARRPSQREPQHY